ncbi:hypothetical protein M514_05035 [Trichuris suis]|uniref:Transcription factor TFIIIC triple barrel domain-containing protein n=1 Tax=Trichuris suis TaxID=68888 RepID=A0A085M9X0_9BILA|nr:hypothetical protein M513_05035 [Trichuris suis]KFD67309.1 hypothetical protein M514_05035 [Trichuris suis]
MLVSSRQEDEEVFVMELNGIMELESLEAALQNGKYEFKIVDDDRIALKIGAQIFLCYWEEVLGTDVIVDTQQLKFVGFSVKRLIGERTIFERKSDPIECSAAMNSAPAHVADRASDITITEPP